MRAYRLLNGLPIIAVLLPALLSNNVATTQAIEPLKALRTTEAADSLTPRQPLDPIEGPAARLSGFSALSASMIQTPCNASLRVVDVSNPATPPSSDSTTGRGTATTDTRLLP